jgi:hypothetical protein
MEAIELYKSNGSLVVNDKANANGTSSSTTTIAKAKAIATAFGIKGDAVTIKRDEAGIALKTLTVMEIGAHAQNPSCIAVSIKHTTKKNGNKRHTYSIEEQCAKSASETAIAAFMGLTVEEVRAIRAKNIAAQQKPIDVPSSSTPVPPTTPPAQ